ncbi:GH92 family glycosyl hydrolase [Phyllobacterium sp. LjRoot231]|uniref:GH92 family glycosyl hydrolase n=1 Tax=Phyllobacterium sp. LjRoot231 TaxID=3342289 RepID=UPI003ECDC600
MTFKKTLFMGLLGCTILAGCNGSNSVVSEPQVGGGTETATFDIANDTNGTTDPVTDRTGIDPNVTTTETTGDQGKGETGDGIDPLPLVQPDTFVPQELAQFVNTTRGSISESASDCISRGNTFPATAMPFGFNMWSPVNTGDSNTFYSPTSNKMRAFAVTHEASKWNGNHQALKFMPVRDETVSIPWDSGETFQRKNEIAKAHYYSVTFDNEMKTEMTPTDHAAYVRFTAPDTMAKTTIAFDTFEGNGSLKVDQALGTASGFTRHGADAYTPRMYFFVKFDSKIKTYKEDISPGDVRSWMQFDTPAGAKVVGMKIATSFISEKQAEDNLNQEIADKSFEDILALAQAAWNQKLNSIQVEGASDDQKTILYSNMYRSFLYPNSAWENVKDANGKFVPTYVSPYIAQSPEGEITNKLKKGKIWVNNGFWDTYRTTWPLYALLIPNEAGEMIDGFVNGFKDGGWTTRWSNPGYRDSMVGTSSDIIFADAYLKGVRNFDVEAAYASMLRNAMSYSSQDDRGRKGMERSVFYGYKPTGIGGGESVAWSLEGYLNDFGLSQMAEALNRDGKTTFNYSDEHAYFANRAISYTNLFDATSTGTWAGGWFRGKSQQEEWDDATGWNAAGPDVWGCNYTEGNAWSYTFLAPQDGRGLANLYGGRAKLKAKLDAFFTAAPSSSGGCYGYDLHEAKEARKVAQLANVGQYQHSNQTVHHSIYMYNYAGAPATGQKYLRDVMDKLYFSGFDAAGNSTGEGYIGDEDNGEQSAWYLFSAMGFYPVSMGRPEYAIGAPYFPKMTVTLNTVNNLKKKIVITAPNVSASNRYVQSLKVNGKPVTKNFLEHKDIANGATLEFVMGPNPSQWGTGDTDVPTSITQGSAKPSPLQSLLPARAYDVTASTADKSANVFDRDSGTEWASASGSAWIEASLQTSKKGSVVKLYTISSAATAGQDPASWTLKASNDDGKTWKTLDQRKEQTFQWRQQTSVRAEKHRGLFKVQIGIRRDQRCGPFGVRIAG